VVGQKVSIHLMKDTHKLVRQWLKRASKDEYDFLVSEAHLTSFQTHILNRIIIHEDSQIKLSLDNNISLSSLKKIIHLIYLKTSKVLLKHFKHPL
jgi:hypothetical protein